MSKKLFLLDGMALAYRAHFAFLQRPIRTSRGLNTSALFGFASTVLDLIEREQPTHLAVAFDTPAPTARHLEFPEYKAQREAMPEDLEVALPNLGRLCDSLRIPVLKLDGYEADDIIGTLVKQAEGKDFVSYMVTPDKDFSQLVGDRALLYKPSRGKDPADIQGVAEVLAKWGVQRTDQVIDVLALWGDASDNIPGVPGFGEKTASKLILQYDNLENLIAHAGELKGKLKESLEANIEQARLCRRLATIQLDVPLNTDVDSLVRAEPDVAALHDFCTEFEFNSLGKRLLGDAWKLGPSGSAPVAGATTTPASRKAPRASAGDELNLFPAPAPEPEQAAPDTTPAESPPAASGYLTLDQTPHLYEIADTPERRAELIRQLQSRRSFCFDTETTGLDPKDARLVGIAFSWEARTGWYVPVPADPDEARAVIREFAPVLADERIEKVGHNLKFDVSILLWHDVEVRGPLFDTMIAHALIEPEMRHGMDYLAERHLGYSPIPISKLIGEDGKGNMADAPLPQIAAYATEDADVTWQLRELLGPRLNEKGQERLFHEVETPLIPVLARMEKEGIQVDAKALSDFSRLLTAQIEEQQRRIQELAGVSFNLNSPKQLGEVLFDRLQIAEKPKKTKTGQYATNEQTLQNLASKHEIVRRILEHRGVTKLKSTYADALPGMIAPRTGRVHTTYQQSLAVTGRLSSHDPNLQNIPIRTELGQEIRKAFVPGRPGFQLMSADYSQIELRIIAALSQDPGMLEAFASGLDIHTATAARVYGVMPALVSDEMRRNAKMVNFGIAYGISAFGLSQRLGIPRGEAAEIIENYFRQYSGIKRYMDATLEFARAHGYVQTVLGRRRYLPDIRSANAAVRSSAERNAINMPIQGTAADMIKVAMVRIDAELRLRKLRTRMLLQIHDELLFDLDPAETQEAKAMVVHEMTHALPLPVPIEVEVGVGADWLEAH
ncbi:MAG: DNA polymerase I [Verrucomicrobia bacterium]|nr:DNA polymerase I [Verrucomicrobiota bacterium]